MFHLGDHIVMTQGVASLMETHRAEIMRCFERHSRCDWGDVCTHDRHANDSALEHGWRLLSVYHLPDETRLWIITDGEYQIGRRYATTLLLPSEY